jgi:hypothetical protein
MKSLLKPFAPVFNPSMTYSRAKANRPAQPLKTSSNLCQIAISAPDHPQTSLPAQSPTQPVDFLPLLA